MAANVIALPVPDAATRDNVSRAFDAPTKISESKAQIEEKRSKAAFDFVKSQIAGAIDGAQVQSAFKTFKEQDKVFEEQLEALDQLLYLVKDYQKKLQNDYPQLVIEVLGEQIKKLQGKIDENDKENTGYTGQKKEYEDLLAQLKAAAAPAAAAPKKA